MLTRASPLSETAKRTPVALLSTVLAIGLLLTWGAAVQARQMIEQSIESRMELQSTLLAANIQNHLETIERDLHSIEGLFLASEEITRDEFDHFTRHLLTDSGVAGIGYMAVVPAADLSAYEERMAAEVPGYRVHELDAAANWVDVGGRDMYFPVEFCTLCGDSIRSRGFDLGSDSNQLPYIQEAIVRAPDARLTPQHTTATPIGSLPFGLRSGIVVYHHVVDLYGNTHGLAFAEILIADVIASGIPESATETVLWNLRDNTGDVPPAAYERNYLSSTPISTGGQSWHLEIWPGDSSPILDNRLGIYWVAATGLLLTLLVAAVVRGRFRRYESTRQVQEMEEILDAKDRFVASVSHELRTPLTAVLGFSEILREKYDGLSAPDRAELVGFISDEAADIAHIVDDLLVVARADHGTLKIATTSVDLEDLVAGVLETMHLSDRIPIDCSEPHLAAADGERVRQIVRNLLNNAVVYGGPQVNVTIKRDADQLTLGVCDDGPGVAESLTENIFEPYQTAHSADGNPQSVGLGLYVARTLARRMRGDLRYTRNGDKTVFELLLPAFVDKVRRSSTNGQLRREVTAESRSNLML